MGYSPYPVKGGIFNEKDVANRGSLPDRILHFS
jgi:hypothetical protein